MIEARKCTDEEKLKNTNMDYLIYFGGAKRYFTKKAIIELQTELKKLRVADVSICTCGTEEYSEKASKS